MHSILDFLKEIETAVMLLSNIILTIYSVIMTIKSKQWKGTARFLVKGNLVKNGNERVKLFDASKRDAFDKVHDRIKQLEDDIIEKGE